MCVGVFVCGCVGVAMWLRVWVGVCVGGGPGGKGQSGESTLYRYS